MEPPTLDDRPAAADGLLELGWDDRLAGLHAAVAPGLEAGRVVAEERGRYLVASGPDDVPAGPSGRLRYAVDQDRSADWPAVGDWVGLERPAGGGDGLIHAVLPRRTALVRRAPSDRGAPTQVLAANVDVVFVVTSLNAELNLRRIERYVAVAWDSGAMPVILLSKVDLAPEAAAPAREVAAVAPGVDVVAVSSVSGAGLHEVRGRLARGRTAVFVGSSGVGKSSLVNALAGRQLLSTAAIREDDARGRHTTTRRQLLRLADGLVIDTPGLRELGVVEVDGVASTFQDVEAVAATCRFADCRHDGEPGCAVRAALADGRLAPDRLAAFRKLEREARRAELAGDAVARKAERRRWSAIMKDVERHMDRKYGAER